MPTFNVNGLPFYASGIPPEATEDPVATPDDPGEFWRQYHTLEQGAREFLEACQAEIEETGRDPGEYFAEMDAWRGAVEPEAE